MFSGFGNIATGADGTYSLSVGGIEIVTQGNGVAAGNGITAASLDTTLTGPNAVSNALAAANITVTGKAADGTLIFTRADGSNLNIEEVVTGSVKGGIGHASNSVNDGSNVTLASSDHAGLGQCQPDHHRRQQSGRSRTDRRHRRRLHEHAASPRMRTQSHGHGGHRRHQQHACKASATPSTTRAWA